MDNRLTHRFERGLDGSDHVLVTADHAHSSQIVDSTPPAALSTAVTTADGTVMKISYGTAAAGGSQQHTGSQVRIAGFGPGAANIVGLTDQTDTFGTITRTLGLKTDTAALSKGAKVSSSYAKPGRSVTVKATGFAGDRQAVVTFGAESQTVDVINGSVAAEFVAPVVTKQTVVKVTVTGVQSDVVKRATATVRK